MWYRNITEPPAYVFWFHNTRMINYGVNGVEVTDKSIFTFSPPDFTFSPILPGDCF